MTTYHNTPGSAKKQRENTEPESRQMAKRQKCSSFFFFFSFFFRRASSKLWLFHDGYYTEQCTSSMLFHNLKSHKAVQTGYWTTMDSSATPFSKLVCMHTNHLATKQLLFKIAELEIQLCAWRQGESLVSVADSVFEQSGQWFFSQHCIHLLRKPMRTDLLLCDIWQTSAQACSHLLLKKVTNKIKRALTR